MGLGSLFSTSSSNKQTTEYYDSSINMADDAIYAGAGSNMATGGALLAGGDILTQVDARVDASVHETLDAELAGKALETMASLANQSIAGAYAANRLDASDIAMSAALEPGAQKLKTIAIAGGAILAAAVLAWLATRKK